MGSRYRYAAVGVAALAVLAVSTATAAPTLDVSIDGAGVSDGDTVTVTSDPNVRLEAAANATIRTVEVRVNGTTRESFDPDSETVTELFELDLDDGVHEVTFAVETEDGERRLTITVSKDSDAPRVSYTSPFVTQAGPPAEQVAVESAEATLAANLSDRSGIERVRIRRVYEWEFAGGAQVSRNTHRIPNPGTNFSQPLLLGLGDNEVTVEVVDTRGQRRRHDITIAVVDIRNPEVDIDRFEVEGDSLSVAGTVSDNVKVDSLNHEVEGTGTEQFVVERTSREPTRDRLAVDFEFTASLPDGTEAITLVATDVSGNERRRELPLDYEGHLEPTVTLDREATRVEGGRLAFAGEVSDSRITRVVVESVGPDGESIDSLTVHEGETSERVPFQGRVGGTADRTTLVVRVTDVRGNEYRREFEVETTALRTATPTSTATRTPTATPNPTTSPTAAADTDDGAETAAPAQQDAGGVGPSLPVPGMAVAGIVGLVVVALAVWTLTLGSDG